MNKLITATAIIILAVASSCKKSNDTSPQPSGKMLLAKIEYPASGGSLTFNYNESGRLLKVTNGGIVSNYAINPFGYEWYNNAVKQSDYSNIDFSGNRVTSFDYRWFNTDGTVAWTEKHSFEYDADGYQVKKTCGSYIYTSEISGGNTVNQTVINSADGTSRATTIEYYTDKQNTLNINFFERWALDHILSDTEVMGKKNMNLPKKITQITPAITYVTEFTFTTDIKGLITNVVITDTTTPTGGAPVISSYIAKFSYF